VRKRRRAINCRVGFYQSLSIALHDGEWHHLIRRFSWTGRGSNDPGSRSFEAKSRSTPDISQSEEVDTCPPTSRQRPARPRPQRAIRGTAIQWPGQSVIDRGVSIPSWSLVLKIRSFSTSSSRKVDVAMSRSASVPPRCGAGRISPNLSIRRLSRSVRDQ